MGGLGYARISILIKNNIEYQRLKAWEDDLISTVWLKVKVGHNKYINVMGGYRQWQLPLELGLGHMGEPEDQYTRLKTIFKQISKAKSTKNQCILGWDSNIDMLETNDNHRKLIRELKEMYETYMDDQDLTIHNTEATRFWSGCRPSLLDQFVSDCPSFIDNVTSYHGPISDHYIITMQYHTNELKEEQQFRMVRNWTNLTPENMMVMIMKNVKLNSILSMQQTNKVWNIFLEEINTIINTLAPAHIIQIKSNHEPYMNEELKEYVKEADEQLDKAITSGAIEEWRLYRQLRNQLYKWIENSKKIHFQNILSTTKNMWKTVQKYRTKISNNIHTRIIVQSGQSNE